MNDVIDSAMFRINRPVCHTLQSGQELQLKRPIVHETVAGFELSSLLRSSKSMRNRGTARVNVCCDI